MIRIMLGISGSGKTKWCTKLINSKKEVFEYINLDSYKKQMTGSFYKSLSFFDYLYIYKKIQTCIEFNFGVLLDSTGLNLIKLLIIEKLINKRQNILYVAIIPSTVEDSEKRINDDIEKGIDRPFVSNKKLKRQLKKYNKIISWLQTHNREIYFPEN